MNTKLNLFIRTAVAIAIAYSGRLYFGEKLPVGVVLNIGFGALLISFWVWEFPWGSVMLLDRLESSHRNNFPHAIAVGNCTQQKCALGGTPVVKCLRIAYMKEFTTKRAARIDDSIMRSSALYMVILILLIIAGSTGMTGGMNVGASNAVASGWPLIQVVIGLVSMAWTLGQTYVEVSYQRLINLDLIV